MIAKSVGQIMDKIGRPAASSSHKGGSAMMLFVNSAVSAHRRALGRKMSSEEWNCVRVEAQRDWLENYKFNDERRECWLSLHRQDRARRMQRGAANVGNDDDGADNPEPGSGVRTPWNGSGDPNWPLATQPLQEALDACRGFPSRSEHVKRAYNMRQYMVMECDKTIAAHEMDLVQMFGCMGTAKNICRTRNAARMLQLDAIHAALNSLLRAVGKEDAESAQLLVLLSGSDPQPGNVGHTRVSASSARPDQIVAMMTAVCYKPAGHVWTLCHIVREHGEGEGEPYFSVPCVVAMTARPTVQSPNLEGSAAVTGWELAEFMAGTCNTWSLSRLRFVADGPLKYTITGADVAAAILVHGERVRTLPVSQVGKDSVLAELRAMLSTKRRRTKGPASSRHSWRSRSRATLFWQMLPALAKALGRMPAGSQMDPTMAKVWTAWHTCLTCRLMSFALQASRNFPSVLKLHRPTICMNIKPPKRNRFKREGCRRAPWCNLENSRVSRSSALAPFCRSCAQAQMKTRTRLTGRLPFRLLRLLRQGWASGITYT